MNIHADRINGAQFAALKLLFFELLMRRIRSEKVDSGARGTVQRMSHKKLCHCYINFPGNFLWPIDILKFQINSH